MKIVYVVRHGQTEFNRQRRLQGWRDSQLSDKGHKQAHKTARALKPLGIGEALCSPLGRARQTAEHIQSLLDIPMNLSADLCEVSFGLWEGHTLDQLQEKWPGEWDKRQADKWHYRPPEGEANQDARQRAERVAQWIENHPGHQPLLIIAHFAINRILLSLLAGIPPGDTVRMDVPHETIYKSERHAAGWKIFYRDLRCDQVNFQPGWLEQIKPENQSVALSSKPTAAGQ